MEPTIRGWIREAITGSAGASAIGTHALNGPKHTGVLAESQAPWAVTQTQLYNHAANPNVHHNAATAGSGISVSTDQVVSLPSTVAGNGLTYTAGVLDVAVSGLGLSVAADVVTLTSASDVSSGIQRILASDASGDLTLADLIATVSVDTPLITSTGDITLSPTGEDVLPSGSVAIDLGDYNRMWRTFFAAEMYVQTLVAQDVIATIGGRVMVSPTSKLIADLSSATPVSTTIDLEHNNFAAGDYLLMQSAPAGVPQIEVFQVTAGPTTIAGGFRYNVNRDRDGTGQNNWYTGDAVASLGGAVGEGYIDLTATSTVLNHFGPTITTYVRTSTAAWDSLVPTTSQGNLESFVDYSSAEYGFALGNDLTLTPATGFSGMTADRTDGLRIFNAEIALYDGATQSIRLNGTSGLDILASTSGGWTLPSGITWSDSIGGTFLAGINYENAASGGAMSVFSTAYSKDAYIGIQAYREGGTGGQSSISIYSAASSGFIQIVGDTIRFQATSGADNLYFHSGVTDYQIWHAYNTPKSASGNRYGVLPSVDGSGVMEIGRYLDFHESDGDTSDYASRLYSTSGTIYTSGNFSVNGACYAGNLSTSGAGSALWMYDRGGGGQYFVVYPQSTNLYFYSPSAGNANYFTYSGQLTIGAGPIVASYSGGYAIQTTAGNGIYMSGTAGNFYRGGGHLYGYVDGGYSINWRDSSGGANLYFRIGTSSDMYSARLQVNGNIHSNGAVTGEQYLQMYTQSAPSAASGWARIWFDGTNLRLTTAAGTYTINKS